MEIFRRDFRLQRGACAELSRVAIVDDTPQNQYLYPEFVLFRQLFRRRGIDAVIASPEALEFRNGLRYGGRQIDLADTRKPRWRL